MSDRSREAGSSRSLQLVRCEEHVLVVALQVAARQGDSSPELIEHTVGSREAATKVMGSWLEDPEPSYLVAMRAAFTARRAARPSRGVDRDQAMVSFPVHLLVVEIASGQITDSGGGMEYPDLAAVGPVVTDYRAGERLELPQAARRALDSHRREVAVAAEAARAARAPVAVSYRGAVTLGSPGRARLHERPGSLGDLIWQVLSDAGWIGHAARLHPLVEVSMSIPKALTGLAPQADRGPLDGGPRSLLDGGRITTDGRVHQDYGGPLNTRAATGVRLVESERRPEDWDALEDMLDTAGVRAGWLEANQLGGADVPDTDIMIRIPRRAD